VNQRLLGTRDFKIVAAAVAATLEGLVRRR
jgi:hypothetical protein